MAYAAGTAKFVVGGSLASGEQFAFGFQVKLPADSAQFALTNATGSVLAALSNNFLTTGVLALFPSSVSFLTLRGYLYTGGDVAAYQTSAAFTGKVGTAAAATLPPQIALVATLETGIPGRSYRGRAYLPPLNVGVIGANGQILSSTCTTIANALASAMTAINATSTVTAQCVVASATKSAMTPIKNVRVDSVFDTQRRRRNKIVPAASVAANL